jgi:hypothetical protein
MDRIIPELCPGCQRRIVAKFLEYRLARRHSLFLPLLIAGLTLALVLGAYLLWMTAREQFDGLGLRPTDRGLLIALTCAATTPTVLWLIRKWRRALDRLPRTFSFTCPDCRWTGKLQVQSDSVAANLDMHIEGETLQAPVDGLAARRERRRQFWERKRKRWQRQQPPNSDFDFNDNP